MRQAMRPVVLVAALLLAAACTGDDDDRSEATTTTTTTQPGSEEVTPTTLSSGQATTTAPLFEEPPADAAAEAETALDPVRAQLPVSDTEYDCVLGRVAGDDELLAAVQEDVSQGSDAYGEIVELSEWCTRAVTGAPPFVANVEERYGALDEEQAGCITDAYLALTDEELQQLIGVAGDPSSEAAAEGRRVMDDLLASCGVGG
jgi:hypothetical protein